MIKVQSKMMVVKKWLVLFVLLLCLISSCLGNEATKDSHGCDLGQYMAQYECRSCDQCPVRHFQLSPCSATENTVCLTYKQYNTGIKCLGHHRHDMTISEEEWMAKRRRACSSIDRRLLEQLHAKLRSLEESRLDGNWHEWLRQQEVRREKRLKLENVATDQVSTTTITPFTTDDVSKHRSIQSMDVPFFSDSERSPTKGGKEMMTEFADEGEWEHQMIVPKINGYSGTKTNPATRPTIPKAGNNVFAHLPPTRGSQDNGHVGLGDSSNVNGKHAIREGDSADTGNVPTSSEGNDSDSSSWFIDHSELMYSLLSAGVVVLVLTVFIASRLKSRGKPAVQLKPKTLKVNENSDDAQGATLDGKHEMGDFELEEIVSKGVPATIGDTPKIRKLSVFYENETDLTKNSKYPLSHSVSSNLEMSSKRSSDPLPHVLKSTASLSRMDWLAKTCDMSSHNDFGSYHSEAETQTDGEMVSHNTKTVFGTKWQFSGTFSGDGGVLQRDNSDVTLVVGREAVPSGSYVTIQGAIFTDASEIRGKFGMASNEMLITPLVEYHAEDSYHFQHHVAVKLPHALPDDYDASLIKFYTFSVDDCGNVLLESLPLKSKDNTSLDDVDAYWEISNQGRCFIAKTKHFSGYFCTTCESKSKLPSVYARVFGSHIQIKSSRREVRLILYLWDRRLNIKDFIEAIHQQECDMDRQLLADEPVPLLDNPTSDSSIVVKMETLGDPEDQKLWRHVTRSNATRPLFRPLQVRKLRQIVLCCQQSDPMRVEWAMENVSGAAFPSNVFQCLIEMVHVPEGTTNYEEALQNAEEEYIRTFYVRNLKMATNIYETSEDLQSRQGLLKKTMSHILDKQDMEGICQAFGLNKKDIGNLSRKFDSDNALKTGLLDECSKVCGGENFLRALPHVLKETQLFHVIEYLQDRDLLSTISSSKAGCRSVESSMPQQQQSACMRQVSESTVCKSVSQPQFEFESSQQQANCMPTNLINLNSSVSQSENPHNPHQLRLQIHAGLMMKNEEGRQVSPDSDYSSPSAIPNRHQINNIYNNAQDTAVVNISPVTGDCNISASYAPSHNNLTNYNYEISHSPTTATRSNCNNASIPTGGNSMQQDYSCSNSNNNTSVVSDDSDFGDSCQAMLDSLDLNDPERIETDTFSMPDQNDPLNETSRKELAVSGLQPVQVKDVRVAYPEVPEEQHMFHNGPPLATPKVATVTPGHCDNKQSEKSLPPPSPQTSQSESESGCVGDDTFVKETFI